MKILFYDLETSPQLSWVWESYEANSLSVEKQRELISFAYKWSGDNKVIVHSQRTLKEKDLVKKLHELFDQADILVAHNGDQFDIKMANSFFIKYGLTPPSPYKTIDTLKIARSKFRFTSNHLNDLGTYLGIGEKVNTGGFSLWLKCMKGEDKSWKLMEKYNRQDVILLEKIYEKLSPWGRTPPINIGLECPNCGSNRLQKRGWSISQLFITQRLQCQNCGRWSLSSNKIKHNKTAYAK